MRHGNSVMALCPLCANLCDARRCADVMSLAGGVTRVICTMCSEWRCIAAMAAGEQTAEREEIRLLHIDGLTPH